MGHAMVPIMVGSHPKKQTIFGYNLLMLTPANGVIIDFTLAPASATDLSVGYELLWG